MTTCGALAGSPACSTRTTVALSRSRVGWPARSSARKFTRFCHTASTVRGPGKASGMSVFTIQSRESAVAVGEHLVAEPVVAVFGKLVLDRVVAVRRQHVGTEAVSTAFDRRQKPAHRLATDVISRYQVIFERHGVELSRDGVAFGLGSCYVDAVRPPAQQLRLHALADRRAFEPSAPRIHHPHAGSLAELRSEVESVIHRRVVRRVTERHLGRRSAPRLVVERGAIHGDHLVEAVGVTAFLGDQEDRRALVRGEPLSVDEELVALRFAAEDGVVVDDERPSALVLLEEDRRGQSADATADGDEVVRLAGVAGLGDALLERAVAQCVSGAQYVPGVAVRVTVVADAAVAVEGVGGGNCWCFTGKEKAGPGEESAVDEVAAGDRLVHAEIVVALVGNAHDSE